MRWWHPYRNWRLAGVTPALQSWGVRCGAGEMGCRGISVAKDVGRVLALGWGRFDGIVSRRESRLNWGCAPGWCTAGAETSWLCSQVRVPQRPMALCLCWPCP